MQSDNQVTITTEELNPEIKTKPLATINHTDFASVLKRIEQLNKEHDLHLNLAVNRDHIIDNSGEREHCELHFSGKLTNDQKESFEKFQHEVNDLIHDSQNSVKWDVKFREVKPNTTIGLKEEQEANKQLKERHDRLRHHLSGVQNPMIRMTSTRTYNSKDGEKFSGNLFIGGDCPEDLKEDFIKYYNEVAKPAPEVYKRENQARLTPAQPKPQIQCSVCKASLDEQPVFFTNKSGGANSGIKICNGCSEKEGELSRLAQQGPLVLVPQKNEIKKKQENQRGNQNHGQRQNELRVFEHPLLRDFDRDFGLTPYRNSLSDFSFMMPLNERFREFERIADRLDRSLNGSIWRPFEAIRFPFDEL